MDKAPKFYFRGAEFKSQSRRFNPNLGQHQIQYKFPISERKLSESLFFNTFACPSDATKPSIPQNNPVAGPPRKSKKNHHDDDEEILSDASDVEGRPGNNGDPGYESVDDGDGDDLRETAEEKAVRLAKIHLEEIEREGESGREFDGCGLKVDSV